MRGKCKRGHRQGGRGQRFINSPKCATLGGAVNWPYMPFTASNDIPDGGTQHDQPTALKRGHYECSPWTIPCRCSPTCWRSMSYGRDPDRRR